ncbi:MAG: Holliday junction resolvase Hjc, partial [Candidatus Bathyarchaeota archaeon]|nr:Holliday junction resolvase Hjc [Candidatus Bathyarchaeota archaeon]
MRRGINEERELVHKLDNLGFAVLRAPSSGSRTKLDRPDIVAGRKGLYLAIEVKSTRKNVIYITSVSIKQLIRFSEKFGAKPFIAAKFKKKGIGWRLIEPEKLENTGKYYRLTLNQLLSEGKDLEAIIT